MIQWIPSHSGLKANEMVDKGVKKFAHYPHSPLIEKTYTLSHTQRSIKVEKDAVWAEE